MSVSQPAYIVDAFTQQPFRGNQAAVCLISKVATNSEYQTIGAEFNLSETAFPVPLDGDYKTASKFSLRWFTPTVEVPLCGHATLATSHVLFYEVGNINEKITFLTKSGELIVSKAPDGCVSMDFPQYSLASVTLSSKNIAKEDGFSHVDVSSYVGDIIDCLVPASISVKAIAYAAEAKKMIVVLDSNVTRQQLEEIACDHKKMVEAHPNGEFIRGIMITVRPLNAVQQGFVDKDGKAYDYASRYFAPWVGIPEDPATGSAQCCLAPYWAKHLQKNDLYAVQCFPRRGAEFRVKIKSSDRLILTGKSQTIVEGKIRF